MRPIRRRYRGLALLGLVVILAASAAWYVESRNELFIANGSEAAMAVVALGALVLGYQQWREARHEISMDKYYERLDFANRRQDGQKDGQHALVHEMMKSCLPELAKESPEVLMYIYVELDNLEYVVEKYRLGYMKAKQACRGLRTFQLRCWSRKFREITQHRVHAGDYNPRTAKVVDEVCKKIEELEARQYRSRSVTAQSSAQGPQGPTSGTEMTSPTPRRRSTDASHLTLAPDPEPQSADTQTG